MNAQNAILRLSSPMLVRCVAAAMVMSSLEGLERPAEDAEQDDRSAHERERQPVGEWREREDWQAQRRDERPDRPTRHMDLGELGAFGDGLELGLGPRSEEHTSELQSRLHLVCRLLLEKKKTRHHFDLVIVTIVKLRMC